MSSREKLGDDQSIVDISSSSSDSDSFMKVYRKIKMTIVDISSSAMNESYSDGESDDSGSVGTYSKRDPESTSSPKARKSPKETCKKPASGVTAGKRENVRSGTRDFTVKKEKETSCVGGVEKSKELSEQVEQKNHALNQIVKDLLGAAGSRQKIKDLSGGGEDQKDRDEEDKSKKGKKIDYTVYDSEKSDSGSGKFTQDDKGTSEEGNKDPFKALKDVELDMYVLGTWFKRQKTLDGNKLSITLSDKELKLANAIEARSDGRQIAHGLDPTRLRNQPQSERKYVKEQTQMILKNKEADLMMRLPQDMHVIFEDMHKVVNDRIA